NLQDKPVLKVFNKKDLVNPQLVRLQCRINQGVAVAAVDEKTLPPLIARLEEKVMELWGKRWQAAGPEDDGRSLAAEPLAE
ncbi:MAG: hypothetical protein PHX53_11185, partial [Syntrophales bacterium]|nr:hypothetical protein [Syntrophales bacterium]